jgi:hypothetical protein
MQRYCEKKKNFMTQRIEAFIQGCTAIFHNGCKKVDFTTAAYDYNHIYYYYSSVAIFLTRIILLLQCIKPNYP